MAHGKPKLQWDPVATAPANARANLPVLAGGYFAAGRKLLKGKHSHKVMHKFRLRTKHFRYTLELFRDVYGPGLEKRLALLKPVQDALGELNDCATAAKLPGVDDPEVAAFLEKRMKKKIAQFASYWRETFDAPGAEEAWISYLAEWPGRVQRKPPAGARSRTAGAASSRILR